MTNAAASCRYWFGGTQGRGSPLGLYFVRQDGHSSLCLGSYSGFIGLVSEKTEKMFHSVLPRTHHKEIEGCSDY